MRKTLNRDQISALARKFGIELREEDFTGSYGYPEIDGMPADEWLDAMTMD